MVNTSLFASAQYVLETGLNNAASWQTYHQDLQDDKLHACLYMPPRLCYNKRYCLLAITV